MTLRKASRSGVTCWVSRRPLKERKNAFIIWSIPKDIKSCFASGMVALKPDLWTVRLAKGSCCKIYLENIAPVLQALTARNWAIYLGPREVWRRTGDRESGQREVFVQDPDGYLIMVAHNIGERPLGDS